VTEQPFGPPAIVDPQAAFYAQDPSILKPPATTVNTDDSSAFTPLALALGGAFLIAAVVAGRAAHKDAKHPDEAEKSLTETVSKVFPKTWVQNAVPALLKMYVEGGKHAPLMAAAHADSLGKHLMDSSIKAVIGGYQAGMNQGQAPQVAWMRALAGFGLTDRDMKTFLSAEANDKTYRTGLIGPASTQVLQKLLTKRADQVGRDEMFAATSMARITGWVLSAAAGDLPGKAKKRWVTANDERVCSLCGPMNNQVKPLDEPFRLPNGTKLYAPLAHPNCRCTVALVNPRKVMIEKRVTISKDYVRTQEGAEKYGLPMGAKITADAEERAGLRPAVIEPQPLKQAVLDRPDFELQEALDNASRTVAEIAQRPASTLMPAPTPTEAPPMQVATEVPTFTPMQAQAPVAADVPTFAPTQAPATTEVPTFTQTEAPTQAPVATELPTFAAVDVGLPTFATTEAPAATDVPTFGGATTKAGPKAPTQFAKPQTWAEAQDVQDLEWELGEPGFYAAEVQMPGNGFVKWENDAWNANSYDADEGPDNRLIIPVDEYGRQTPELLEGQIIDLDEAQGGRPRIRGTTILDRGRVLDKTVVVSNIHRNATSEKARTRRLERMMDQILSDLRDAESGRYPPSDSDWDIVTEEARQEATSDLDLADVLQRGVQEHGSVDEYFRHVVRHTPPEDKQILGLLEWHMAIHTDTVMELSEAQRDMRAADQSGLTEDDDAFAGNPPILFQFRDGWLGHGNSDADEQLLRGKYRIKQVVFHAYDWQTPVPKSMAVSREMHDALQEWGGYYTMDLTPVDGEPTGRD
jgi:hypothetical protein